MLSLPSNANKCALCVDWHSFCSSHDLPVFYTHFLKQSHAVWFPWTATLRPPSHYQKWWRCRKPTLISIIVMILWQHRLPCLRCRACKNGLAANRPPVMEPVIGWLAKKRMWRCLVNGWPIRWECGPQGRKVPIKGCFPPHRLIVIVIHIKPFHTITPLFPSMCCFLCRRLLNYNF